jgi:hypothetical protein
LSAKHYLLKLHILLYRTTVRNPNRRNCIVVCLDRKCHSGRITIIIQRAAADFYTFGKMASNTGGTMIGAAVNLGFRGWLLANETSAAEMPELKTAVQSAIQSGQEAGAAVRQAMMRKLEDPKVDVEKVADLAKVADKLVDQDKSVPGGPGATPMQSAMKKKMRKKMRK